MQAVPLDFLSGERQPAQQNGLCELVAGSRKRVPMLQSNIPAQITSLWELVMGATIEAVYKAGSINGQ